MYPASTDAEASAQTNTYDRDEERVSTFLWGTEWLADATSPVYTYYWTHTPPGQDTSNPVIPDQPGAFHGSEMNYVFDNLYGTDRPWTAADHRIADTLSSYIVDFAATGSPNGRDHRQPRWPQLDSAKPAVMEVGNAFRPIPAASTQARYEFIKRWLESQPKNW